MNLNLNHKKAFVCGSTQGIGKAAAIELASLGCKVTLIARNEKKLKQVISELPGSSGHDYIVADFTKPDELKQAVEGYLEQNEEVHILINNGGGPAPGPALEASPENFINAFQQHLVCYQILVQLTVPLMKKAGYGRIINIISTSVKEPIRNLGVSNTIRGAVASWAKTLAAELAPFGITVNNILPGFTATDRLQGLIESRSKNEGLSVEEVEKAMKNSVPAGRFADPSETAAAIAFLASESAGYVNGVNLPVDGGKTGCL